MAIFSRRTLQRLLAENTTFLSPSQVAARMRVLNNDREPEQALAAEWELVLLNALSKAGRLGHEVDFGGPRRADVHFEVFDQPDISFLADITTVSDQSLHDKNPIEYFAVEYKRLATAYLPLRTVKRALAV